MLRVLRNLEKSTFVLSGDVFACLKGARLDIDKACSKQKLKLIQATFNQWLAEAGLLYSHLSRICSCSVGENYSLEAVGEA